MLFRKPLRWAFLMIKNNYDESYEKNDYLFDMSYYMDNWARLGMHNEMSCLFSRYKRLNRYRIFLQAEQTVKMAKEDKLDMIKFMKSMENS